MSNEMLDAFTRHQIFVQRYATGQAKNFDAYLRRADKVIRDVLSAQDDVISSRKALASVIADITAGIGKDGVYGDYVQLLEADLADFAGEEIGFTVKTLENGTTAAVLAPEAAAVVAATYRVPLGLPGAMPPLLDGFIKQLTTTEVRRINNVITSGFSEGRTTMEMTRQIRGTRANRFNDGILATTQRNAYAIARTSVNHVATQAREASYSDNDDILDGVEWSSTLDRSTSDVCRFYDGKIFPANEGPRPPAHVGCRSATLPVVKPSLSIFAGNEERVSVGADGPKVVTSSKYYTWLKTQPAAFQDDVLGVSKGKLFRNSGLSPDEFKRLTSNSFGKSLTLKEIKAKDAKAWGDANLD